MYVYVHVHAILCICVHIYAHLYMCIYVHMTYICVHVYSFIYKTHCIYVRIWHIYMYMYIPWSTKHIAWVMDYDYGYGSNSTILYFILEILSKKCALINITTFKNVSSKMQLPKNCTSLLKPWVTYIFTAVTITLSTT